MGYLYGVAAVSATDVWAVGSYYSGSASQTLVEHWNGTSWSVVPSPNAGTGYNLLYGVAAVAANDVWAVGYGSANQTLVEHYGSLCIPTCGLGSDYVFTQSSEATLVPGDTLVPGSQCDDCLVPVPLPFTYNLYNLLYTKHLHESISKKTPH